MYSGRDANVQVTRSYPIEVTYNTLPKNDGIAIFRQPTEPDWSWPDYVITAGTVDIGRNHRDAHISGPDFDGQLVDILDSVLADQAEAEDSEE